MKSSARLPVVKGHKLSARTRESAGTNNAPSVLRWPEAFHLQIYPPPTLYQCVSPVRSSHTNLHQLSFLLLFEVMRL